MKSLSLLLSCLAWLGLGSALAASLHVETAAATAADRDWATYEAATKAEPATPLAGLPIVEQMKFQETRALRLRELGLAFIENHPTDPRRWVIVSRFFPHMPRFVKEYGPPDEKGFPTLVIDEAAAVAWRAKVTELKAAMAQATDVPAEIAEAAAKAAKAQEERSGALKARLAKWRSGREMAPDFPMQDLAGREVKLADFRGKVVVLDFWATWCGPCKAAMPHTQEVAAKYKAQGVVVLASCTRDKRENFEKWVKANQAAYPDILWAHDPAAMEEQRAAKRLYDTPGIPCQFVIDREGRVSAVVFGYMSGEVLLDAALAKAGIHVDAATLAQAEADWKARVNAGMDY